MRALRSHFNFLLFGYGINGNLFAVFAHSLELNLSVDERKQRIVFADAYVIAGFEFGAALSYENVARKHELTVRALNAKHFRVTVSAVVRRAGTFFMSE
jgi:hypothetical protein